MRSDRQSERSIYGQAGQEYDQSDWIISQFPDGYSGYAIDVGAMDGLFFSNTLKLERERGWTVLCVEANPYIARELAENRSHWLNVAISDRSALSMPFHINGDIPASGSHLKWPDWAPPRPGGERWYTVSVPVMTLDLILAWSGFDKLDVVSMDIEFGEQAALAAFDVDRWKPKVMVVESNIDPCPYARWFTEHSYDLARRVGTDNLYVRKDV
jgi:FkbM family methyltransferase